MTAIRILRAPPLEFGDLQAEKVRLDRLSEVDFGRVARALGLELVQVKLPAPCLRRWAAVIDDGAGRVGCVSRAPAHSCQGCRMNAACEQGALADLAFTVELRQCGLQGKGKKTMKIWNRSYRALAAAAGCLMFAMAGCASLDGPAAPENSVADGFQAPPAGALIMLARAAPLSGRDVIGSNLVLAQLDVQLRAAGYRVRTLDDDKFESMWREELRAQGSPYDSRTGAEQPEAMANIWTSLARRIAAQTHCDFVLEYQLVTRSAALVERTAQWDGIRRGLEVVPGQVGVTAKGHQAALSVELRGYSVKGEPQLRQIGGTSLSQRFNPHTWKLEPRNDLFLDDSDTADGVRVALRTLVRH